MSGRFLRDLAGRSGTVDGDAPRLHGLGDFSDQFDPEQPVVERRGLDLDVVGKVELPLEGPSRNALVEIFVLVLVALAAFHREHVLLSRHRDLIRAETSQGQRDLVTIFADPLDVVGRVVILGPVLGLVEEIEKAVEAHGRTPQGSKVVSPHSQVLLRARWIQGAQDICARHPSGALFSLPDPSWRPAPPVSGKNSIRKTKIDFKSGRKKILARFSLGNFK